MNPKQWLNIMASKQPPAWLDMSSAEGANLHLLNEDTNEKYALEEQSPLRTHIWLPWSLSAIFAILSIILYFRDNSDQGLGSYTSGWKSDLAPAKSQIEIQQKQFFGGAIKDLQAPLAEDLIYEGQGPDSDAAWSEILGGQYFLITHEEAVATLGDRADEYYDESHGGYRASIGVLHALHCVDYFRRLTPTVLESVDYNLEARRHHMHCLGQVRQYIMCYSDLSPMPAIFGRGYPNPHITHTCRNFDTLREWAWERHNGSLAVAPDWSTQREIVR